VDIENLDLWTELGELRVHITANEIRVFGPNSTDDSPLAPSEPAALREWTRVDDLGRYRPLPGARTMRSNWQVAFPSLAAFTDAMSEVYPLAFEHSTAWQEGRLRIVGLDEVLSRQSGRYEVAAKADETSRQVATAVLCGRCVKRPVWRDAETAVAIPGDTTIPCPEPCSVLVSLCREAALWQDDPPEPSEVDLSVAFAAFEEPGNEIREAYLRARYGGPREQ